MQRIYHTLNQMNINVEELKRSQPSFFETIVVCYQHNLAKLQQQTAQTAQVQSEAELQQLADQCLAETIIAQIRQQEQDE